MKKRVMRTSVEERFWIRVQKTDTCWQWIGSLVFGYGQFAPSRELRKMAHRWAYEQLVGPIPDGKQLDHLCRNRACVNPAHLEPVSIKENVLRGIGTSATNARKTHCKYGHEFTASNTVAYGPGRTCRTCAWIRSSHTRKRRAYLDGGRYWERSYLYAELEAAENRWPE